MLPLNASAVKHSLRAATLSDSNGGSGGAGAGATKGASGTETSQRSRDGWDAGIADGGAHLGRQSPCPGPYRHTAHRALATEAGDKGRMNEWKSGSRAAPRQAQGEYMRKSCIACTDCRGDVNRKEPVGGEGAGSGIEPIMEM